MTDSHQRPEHPGVPDGFKLEIPNLFKDAFKIPLVPLGTWKVKAGKGQWIDKAPADTANGWQMRDSGFIIPASATGFGVPAGKNGLFFLDLDTHHDDENGPANFQRAIEEFGNGVRPQACELVTGSGARQLLWKINPETAAKLRPSRGSTKFGIFPGGDTRVNDSYSVMAGSIVTQPDNTIGHYKFAEGSEHYADLTLADLPAIEDVDWLLDLLLKTSSGEWGNPWNTKLKKSKPTARKRAAEAKVPTDFVGNEDAKQLETVLDFLSTEVAASGKRHPNLWKAGLKAGKLQLAEETFISFVISALEASSRDADNVWHGYDFVSAEKQLRSGWSSGLAESFSEALPSIPSYRADAALKDLLKDLASMIASNGLAPVMAAGYSAGTTGVTLEDTLRVLKGRILTIEPTHSAKTVEEKLTEGWTKGDSHRVPEKFFFAVSMAQRFAEATDDLLFVPDHKCWRRYRNPLFFADRPGVWTLASENEPQSIVSSWILKEYAAAQADDNPILVKGYGEYLKKPTMIREILKEAETAVSVEKSRFNQRKELLVVQNGIVNLKTGKLHPHSPRAYSTMTTGIKYTPGAKSEVFNTMLNSISPECMDYMRMIFGIMTTGYTPLANSYFIMKGPAGNGKSTLLDSQKRALGDYAAKLEKGALAADSGNTFGLHAFEHKRMVYVEEIGGRFYDGELVKDLTGAAEVEIAAKHKSSATMENHSTLLMAMNNPIASPAKMDLGIRRRVKVIPFNRTVKEAHEYDPSNPDHLPESLAVSTQSLAPQTVEASLAFLVECAMEWLNAENKLDLEKQLPAAVAEETKVYTIDEDPFEQIAEDNLVYMDGSYITTEDMKTLFDAELDKMGSAITNQKTIFGKLEATNFFMSNGITKKKTPGQSRERSRPPRRLYSIDTPPASVRFFDNVAFISTVAVTDDSATAENADDTVKLDPKEQRDFAGITTNFNAADDDLDFELWADEPSTSKNEG